MTVVPEGAQAAYDSWASYAMARSIRPLSVTGARHYERIWHNWIKFLAGRRKQWHEAKEVDVAAFLKGVKPNSGTIGKSTSEVTIKRYSTILGKVYSYGALLDSELANPVPRSDKTAGIPAREEPESLVLNAVYLDKLMRCVPPAADSASTRDAAILNLLMRQALTTAEIRGLKMQDVVTTVEGAVSGINIKGKRKAQQRLLTLDPVAKKSLGLVVYERRQFGAKPNAPVFIGTKVREAISAVEVFRIAQTHITENLIESGEQDSLHHAGPTALRNARLARWLEEGKDPMWVAGEAGLLRVRGLKRIADHCSERVRGKFTNSEPAPQRSE